MSLLATACAFDGDAQTIGIAKSDVQRRMHRHFSRGRLTLIGMARRSSEQTSSQSTPPRSSPAPHQKQPQPSRHQCLVPLRTGRGQRNGAPPFANAFANSRIETGTRGCRPRVTACDDAAHSLRNLQCRRAFPPIPQISGRDSGLRGRNG